MIKKRFKEEISAPCEVVGKLKRKTTIYLALAIVFLIISSLLYWVSNFTLVELPTLLSVAQTEPISFVLSIYSSASTDTSLELDGFTAIIAPNGFIKDYITGISSIFFIVALGVFAINKNVDFLVGSLILSVMLGCLPSVMGELDSWHDDYSNKLTSEIEEIQFGEWVKSGNIKEFIEGVGKYSKRGKFIISSVIDGESVTPDDAMNLLDAFSEKDAQYISVGLAETMSKALANGVDVSNNSITVTSALAAYTLSYIRASGSKNYIDERTGFAIFDAAKDFTGFNLTNSYADVVKAKAKSQKKLRLFLMSLTGVLLVFGCSFLSLWFFSLKNRTRVETAFIEQDKLRNSR